MNGKKTKQDKVNSPSKEKVKKSKEKNKDIPVEDKTNSIEKV